MYKSSKVNTWQIFRYVKHRWVSPTFETNIVPLPRLLSGGCIQNIFRIDFSRKLSKILFSLEPLRAPAAMDGSYLIGGKSSTSYSPDCRTSVSRASFPVQGRSARPTGSFRSCASARNARPLDDGRLSFAVKENREINVRGRAWTGGEERETRWGSRRKGKDLRSMTRRGESQAVSIGLPTEK